MFYFDDKSAKQIIRYNIPNTFLTFVYKLYYTQRPTHSILQGKKSIIYRVSLKKGNPSFRVHYTQ